MPHKKSAVRPNPAAPTSLSFGALQTAYDFFNEQLFEGRLPPCMILLHRHKNAHGYFWADRFGHRDTSEKLHEIAINPATMRTRTDRDVLATLVHEMTHLEQQVFGKPPSNGYHDKAWGLLMTRVGLEPSTTGRPGGRRTGAKVAHYIVEGGPFDVACAKLLATGLSLPYVERSIPKAVRERAKAKRASKTKFQCPTCDAACWGKPTLCVMCGECEEIMEAVL